jgi:hypothetical protein
MNRRALSACAALFLVLTAACATDVAAEDGEQGASETNAAPAPAVVDETNPRAIAEPGGGAAAVGDGIVVKACVNKCENWCTVLHGRTICGTSCICTFQ